MDVLRASCSSNCSCLYAASIFISIHKKTGTGTPGKTKMKNTKWKKKLCRPSKHTSIKCNKHALLVSNKLKNLQYQFTFPHSAKYQTASKMLGIFFFLHKYGNQREPISWDFRAHESCTRSDTRQAHWLSTARRKHFWIANNLYSRKDTSTICGSYGWALHLTFFGTGPQAQVQIRLQKA